MSATDALLDTAPTIGRAPHCLRLAVAAAIAAIAALVKISLQSVGLGLAARRSVDPDFAAPILIGAGIYAGL